MENYRLNLEHLLKQDFLMDELEDLNLIPKKKISKYFNKIVAIYVYTHPAVPFEEFFHLVIKEISDILIVN